MITRRSLLLMPVFLLAASIARPQSAHDLGALNARDSIAACWRAMDASPDGPRRTEYGLRAWTFARDHVPELTSPCRLRLAETYLRRGLPERALEHAEAVALAEPTNPHALHLKASALAAGEQWNRAIGTWSELLTRATPDTLLRMGAYDGLMRSYAAIGDRASAIANGEHARELYHLRNERLLSGACSNFLGHLAAGQGRHHAAMRYFMEAMDDLQANEPRRTEAHVNMAATLVRLRYMKQAFDELDLARVRALTLGERSLADRISLLRAAAYLAEGRSMDALQEARAAKERSEARADTVVLIEADELLAHIHGKYGQHQQARLHTAQARALSNAVAAQELLVREERQHQAMEAQSVETQFLKRAEEQQRQGERLRRTRAEADERSRQLELARMASEMRATELQRAMEHADAEQRLALARTALEDEQQMRTIQSLELDRRKQELQLARSEQRDLVRNKELEVLIRDRSLQALTIQREEARRRSAMWLMLLLAALVLGAIAWLIAMRSKNRTIHTQVAQIRCINAELSSKNSDLLSSINYALRIQRAIVPTEEELRRVLPDSFLFYKPRDIVSGDLPFVRQEGTRTFVATIDCTGHGVPAAMLSFMAYYNLNDIIGSRPGIAVGEILDELHQRIHASQEFGDGMDITLVEVDPERRVLWYSGAQNSLLLVREGECHRIRGEKCSIGDPSGACGMGFRTHRIDLHPNDRIYMYSDGFVHQFGGPSGRKKFGSAQLMSTLAALGARPAEEVATTISEAQRTWQQEQPQTDDIVLIGFSLARTAASRAA